MNNPTMQEFYFANCRLLLDEAICEPASMRFLSAFKPVVEYDYSMKVNLGAKNLLDAEYEDAVKCPVVFESVTYDVRQSGNGWLICSNDRLLKGSSPAAKFVLKCSDNYHEMTLFAPDADVNTEEFGMLQIYSFPFCSMMSLFCMCGIVYGCGYSIHASFVEKDGFGVLFTGPSGIGKSTQAGLWEKYQGAEIINGDRPVLFKRNGIWYGAGIPWDGKDQIYKQRILPVKGIVVLEQAKENVIETMNAQEAMGILLKQVMLPSWDNKAMDAIINLMYACVNDIPFYHLRNLPVEDAVKIACQKIYNAEM